MSSNTGARAASPAGRCSIRAPPTTWNTASCCFRRAFVVVGATPDDLVHVSFPLGIHPVAHLYARAAEDLGIGTIWCGSGSNTPSLTQLELIRDLKPTIWAGMAQLRHCTSPTSPRRRASTSPASSVRKIIVAAEPLSPAKRQKLERVVGRGVSDQFGMTEGALISVQAPGEDGLRVWSDLFLCEVVDETTGEPVPEGEVGTLVDDAAVQQQRHAVPALEFRRSRQHVRRGRRQRAVVDLPGHAARAPHRRLLQGARRQHQSQRAGRPDVLQSGASPTSRPRSTTPQTGLDVLRLLVEPQARASTSRRVWSAASARTCAKSFEVTPEIAFLEPAPSARNSKRASRPRASSTEGVERE